MNLGLLQCDHVRPDLRAEFGDYDAMFRALFRANAPGVTLSVFDVTKGEFPEAPDSCDGYLTTGSAASVYDDEPWLAKLTGFVRELYAARRPFVGICFGHQLMAEALGGKVAASPRGWGVGSKAARIETRADWMVPDVGSIRLLLSHQDQVESLPPDATVIAGNEHCPYAIITVGETFLGFQGHPEFTPGYARALMLSRTDRIPPATVESALPTFSERLDDAAVVSWIVCFIDGRARVRALAGGRAR